MDRARRDSLSERVRAGRAARGISGVDAARGGAPEFVRGWWRLGLRANSTTQPIADADPNSNPDANANANERPR
jgi:hypothetical protein